MPARGGRHRSRRRTWLLSVVAVATAALIGTTISLVASSAQADQTTQGVDNLRTNWDQNESGLSPAVVQSSAFGRLFATKLDGQIYAQPLVLGDQVIAVTESNTLYGLDRTTGEIEWSKNYGPAWPASAIGCGDLVPNVGATATPVYDSATDSLYFTTKVDDGTSTHRHPKWLMHAVDPASGAERAGWPVTIAGSPVNDPGNEFDAYYEQQRPGLLLMDGVVYAGFGGHCDAWPYRGYVVGVSTTGHSITSMWASVTGASTGGAGIWQSGGGLVSDGSGRIFFSTGNGISPAPGPGKTVQGTLAESVVRLQVNADNSLSTADFFSPSDAATLDLTDQDISSGAPMALPDGFGTSEHPHLLIQQGKDGRIFLLDRDDLGGMGQGPQGGDAAVSKSGPYQGMWGHPAFWGGDGGYVYVVGNQGPLRALKYGVRNGGTPALTLTGQSQDTFGYTSGSPLVTSDGTDESSALVWMTSASNASGADGTLRAYGPTPDGNGHLPLLWSAPIGTATKFSTPTAERGKVYVGTRDGVLYGFGSPARTALTAASLDFGQVGVGSSDAADMKLTATQDVSITGLKASGAFSVDPSAVPTPEQPTALAADATLDVPISFTPTATGGINGTLTANLSDGQKLVFALHGVGTRPGLGAAPAALDFGEVPTGSTSTLNLQITNTGTEPETVDSVDSPSGAFSTSGLPSAGTVVPAGGSFVVSVTYTPTDDQEDSDALVVSSSGGGDTHTLSVPVSATAITGQGHLEFSTSSLDFGQVPIGSSRSLSFTITNTGNIPVTVTKAKAPTGDFNSAVQLSEGLIIGPEQTAVQSVTFTPRSAADLSAFYEVTGTGTDTNGNSQGAMYVPVKGTGTGTATTTSAADGKWQTNGSAVPADGGGVQLTPATSNQAGTAVYTEPLRTDGLRATFTTKFGPGNGGKGMTFALLDPAQNSASALGGTGDGLGIAGRPGTVIALGSGYNDTLKAQNFVGVGRSSAGSSAIDYQSVVPLSTALRQGTHQVDIQVAAGHVYVWLDGAQVMDATPTLTSTALLAFSGATGDSADVQTVSGPVVSEAAPPATEPKATTSLHLTAPSTAVPGRQLTVDGTLASSVALPAGLVAHITRNGTALPDVTTKADGSFTFSDTPPAEGTYTYAASYAGDGTHEAASTSSLVQVSKLATSVTLAAPATATRAQKLTVTGTLSGSPFATGGVVKVTKTDLAHPSGIALADAKVASNGSFTFTDTPQIGGANTYKVAYGGDISHKPGSSTATTQVSRAAASVTITADHSTYNYSQSAKITAHLGTTYNSRTVAIYAKPFGGTSVLVKSGTVDSHGNLTASYKLSRNTTLSAVFAGDYRYAPKTAARTVHTHVRISEKLSGYYTSTHYGSTLYRVYHHTAKEQLDATVTPNKAGQCIKFRVQRYYSGAWHTQTTTPCSALSSASAGRHKMALTSSVNSRFRIAAEYVHSSRDNTNLSTWGAWQYFTVRQ
ncbi:choice-of-anchor D domain-containing protein [Streptomyces canus]|uniref:Ig-like domain-containing protein n=1 Tax=Streptomyces canus TaxID=58343 RepID=UPI002DDA9B8D|nr:choice-of-anchor D domain-containing protein [Streptomyces canus]WSD86606.1 choice-of-anchor D domain-containing protein [Streptomyces canus]